MCRQLKTTYVLFFVVNELKTNAIPLPLFSATRTSGFRMWAKSKCILVVLWIRSGCNLNDVCLSSLPVQPCVNLNCVLLGLWHCENLKINVGLRNVRHPELKEPVSIERHFNGADRLPITIKDKEEEKTVSCISEAKPALCLCLSFVSLMIGISFKSAYQPEMYFVTVYFLNITACLWFKLLLYHLCLQGHL